MMNGATDSAHYTDLSHYIFRFSPMVLSHEDQETVHGVNERLSFENAARMVGFMQALIRNASELDFESSPDEDGDFYEEEVAEEIAIRRLEKPLPTKPLRKVEVDEEELPDFDPLPEDDEPLDAKPLTESDPED